VDHDVFAWGDGVLETKLAELSARAPRIPFVTLVEHVERLAAAARPVGERGLVHEEIVRFSHDPSLVFHTSDVSRMEVVGGRVCLTTTFLGATGAVSPLASFFTEDVLRAEAQDAPTLGAFYDLFHHRLLALVYRALRRSRPVWSSGVGEGGLVTRALALAGLDAPRRGMALSPLAMLGRARILARRPRGKDALVAALALAFPSVPFRVVDFLPRRVRLADDQRLRLGVQRHTLGKNTRLGRHVTSQADLVRLVVGPVDRATLERFMPGPAGADARDGRGASYERLRRVVDAVTGGMVEVEAEIEVQRGAEPRACLGRAPGQARASLGRSALLLTSRSPRSLRVRTPLGADPRASFHQTHAPAGNPSDAPELPTLLGPAPEAPKLPRPRPPPRRPR